MAWHRPGDMPLSEPMMMHWAKAKRKHFADNIFKCIFLNENYHIDVQISMNLIGNKSALVHVMALSQ